MPAGGFSLRLLAQILLKPCQRALPGELSRGPVIARRGIIMKAVVNTLINIGLVDFIVCLQRFFIGGSAFINAAIESGIMQQQRRFNFIDLLQRRLAAVKRHRAG